jgi:nitrile hydratase beta subunit-like protein
MLEHSHHDMGGEVGQMRAGPVQRTEHDYAEWERRIDAMAILLWAIKGGRKYFTVDEHRKNIEALPPEAYDRLSYYEKWITALTQCLIQRGVVTTAELARKMEEVEKRCSRSS